jgi:MATE family multidrug resistance protein
MFIGVISYWLVALPISYLAAFPLGLGPSGIWIGFVAGLALAATALVTRVLRRAVLTNSFRRIANSSIVSSQS